MIGLKKNVRCTWLVLVLFLATFFSPPDAFSFDTDALKTAGIITGATLGVALVVVLIIGVVRDTKGHGDDEEGDDDVWSQAPALRTLGYKSTKDPLLGKRLAAPEGPSSQGRMDEQELEAFLRGKMDRVPPEDPWLRYAPHRGRVEFSLSNPEADSEAKPPPFSLWQEAIRSHPTEGWGGRTPGTT